MAHITIKRAYENKSWNRDLIFFFLKHNLLIWYKSVTQMLGTLLIDSSSCINLTKEHVGLPIECVAGEGTQLLYNFD